MLTSKEDFSVEISSDSDLEDPLKSAQTILISTDDEHGKDEAIEKETIKKKKKNKKNKQKGKSHRDSRSRSRSISRDNRRSRSRSRIRHKNKKKEKRLSSIYKAAVIYN